MTAEVVKTLENAYRDVRIAYATEVVRYCDERNLDFYQLRDQVNARTQQTDQASADGQAIPTRPPGRYGMQTLKSMLTLEVLATTRSGLPLLSRSAATTK